MVSRVTKLTPDDIPDDREGLTPEDLPCPACLHMVPWPLGVLETPCPACDRMIAIDWAEDDEWPAQMWAMPEEA